MEASKLVIFPLAGILGDRYSLAYLPMPPPHSETNHSSDTGQAFSEMSPQREEDIHTFLETEMSW